GRRALLLGAGGAARAAAFALLDADVDALLIVNRNTSRAQSLCTDLQMPERVRSAAWSELADVGAFDLLINATAAGHDHRDLALPPTLPGADSVCYDLSYGAAAQPFLRWAHLASAAHVLDGLGMLVEQAAESHALWFGRVPQTAAIYDELRAGLTPG
ncbi:MAG: shikimate dehydrogenase, partial [Dokdonella sp.]